MPEISRFLGIIIAMYFKEHGGPHFHARYGDYRAVFSIDDLQVLEGGLPRRVTALVLEWAFGHRKELLENWRRAAALRPLRPVPPLE